MPPYHDHRPYFTCQGAVLLVILVFLQIFILLGLYGLTSVQMMIKHHAEAWQSKTTYYLASAYLIYLEQQIVDQAIHHLPFFPFCLVSPMAAFDLQSNPFTWWQEHACVAPVDAYHQAYYMVESLGEGVEGCGVIQIGNKPMVPDYVRITLFVRSNTTTYTKPLHRLLVQSTVAIPSERAMPLCNDPPHLVRIGRQMWREL